MYSHFFVSSPDQNENILSHYVDEMIVGRENLTVQTVAYDCSNHLTNVGLFAVLLIVIGE